MAKRTKTRRPKAPPGGDTSKPLAGKDVSSQSQLAGTWMEVTDGLYAGLEFRKDGQALITHDIGLASALTGKYEVLDGGRLSLVAPDGSTVVFHTTRSDDLMELKLESGAGAPGDLTQRFKRLPEGKVLAEAIKERNQLLAVERKNRVAALMAAITQPDLVIAPTQAKGEPFTLTLTVSGVAGI